MNQQQDTIIPPMSDQDMANRYHEQLSCLQDAAPIREIFCRKFEAAINSHGQIPHSHLGITLLSDLSGKATECYASLGYVDQSFLERAGFSRYVISHFIHQINFERAHEVTTQNAEEHAA